MTLTIPRKGSIEEEMVDIIFGMAEQIQSNVGLELLRDRAIVLVDRLMRERQMPRG